MRWLLAQGIGDKARVGIVGHSFGGYSTLLGLAFQPVLFKPGVAGSPPLDLGLGMRWLPVVGDQGDLPDLSLRQTLRALSLDGSDPATFACLHAQSPRMNEARMRRPLLVMAGGPDRTVAIREVTDYEARLRTLGQPVSLLVGPGGGHSPVDSITREAYHYAMEVMLKSHLGGPQPEPPGQRLPSYSRQNLRLAGVEFTPVAPRHL